MLIKSLIWNALLTWTQIPKMKHFRSIETKKMKAKVGIYEDYLEMLIITVLKSDMILSVVDRNVAIFTIRHTISCYEFEVS